ncbi:hypothetical protein MSAN_01315900 [Mycena sanguinolenta]|uniref:Uncharacterized protein n=1 Tax=Mycena sanguinolenta TaxID=230812 RepID=A0A8H6YA42_9AGAR|nr:hypothetical protein MSAN_01315900 [Mycena sanguinolenta]
MNTPKIKARYDVHDSLQLFLQSPCSGLESRLQSLEAVAITAFLITLIPGHPNQARLGTEVPWDILFPTFCCMLIHHAALVVNWPIPSLALIDLILIFLEISGWLQAFPLPIGLSPFGGESTYSRRYSMLLAFHLASL